MKRKDVSSQKFLRWKKKHEMWERYKEVRFQNHFFEINELQLLKKYGIFCKKILFMFKTNMIFCTNM